MTDGVLLINKKKFDSSGKVLGIFKRRTKIKKAGIYGILDPLATGILPIVVGEANKYIPFIQSNNKTYNVKCKLGEYSECGDYESDPIIYPEEKNRVLQLTRDYIIQTFNNFVGEYNQVPPMFSATKYKGKPLYSYARNNINIKRERKKRFIHELKFISLVNDMLTFNVMCSPGTYIRTLIQDIAKDWSLHACLYELNRSKVEPFENFKSFNIEDIDSDQLDKKIINITDMLPNYPEVICSEDDITNLYYGLSIQRENNQQYTLCKLIGEGGIFHGLGIFKDHSLYPKRLIKR